MTTGLNIADRANRISPEKSLFAMKFVVTFTTELGIAGPGNTRVRIGTAENLVVDGAKPAVRRVGDRRVADEGWHKSRVCATRARACDAYTYNVTVGPGRILVRTAEHVLQVSA